MREYYRRCAGFGWLILLVAGLTACSPSTYFASYNDALDTGAAEPTAGTATQRATLDLQSWSAGSCGDEESEIARGEPGIIQVAAYAAADRPAATCIQVRSATSGSFVGVALSGGGARAAVFSSAVLFELQALGVMDQVDVVSAVSGGALTAALYAISCDPDDLSCERTLPSEGMLSRAKTRPDWSEEEVIDQLSRSYIARWVLNRLWPDNVARSLFTSYDGTDVFAETLSDNLYDTSTLGGSPFTLGDLNPSRPALIISATDYSEGEGDIFTFTREDFGRLNSDVRSFWIARAVAASSAYPGVFNYSTLAVWTPVGAEPEILGYKHLFDGGASDNLAVAGLEKSLKTTLLADRAQPDQLIFLVVDAQNGFNGVSREMPDPRKTVLGIVDLNFLDAYDTLMERTYAHTLDYLKERLKINLSRPVDSNHIHIEHIGLLTLNRRWFGYGTGRAPYVKRLAADPYQQHKSLLWRKIRDIDTGYGLSEEEQACLRASAYLLVNDKIDGLSALLDFVPDPATAGARKNNFEHQYRACVLPSP